MNYSLMAGLILSLGLTACSKNEEAAAPEPVAPAAEAPAPASATEVAAPAPTAAATTDFDAAAKFKTTCASCHGAEGQGVATFPKLVGKTTEDVKAKLTDYRAGKTLGPQTAVMAPNAAKLTDSEIEGLATYIATLK
jgi:cytochrome c553